MKMKKHTRVYRLEAYLHVLKKVGLEIPHLPLLVLAF